MEVVRNHYKFFVLAFALSLFSCKEQNDSSFTSEGLHLNDDHVFVSDLHVDSIDFANGKTLWIFDGAIVVEGKELKYQVLFDNNPVNTAPVVVRSKPPIDFKTGSEPHCVVTEHSGWYEISWRSKNKFLHLKSGVTSEH